MDSPLQENMGAFGISLLSPLSILLYLLFFPEVRECTDNFISTFYKLLIYTTLISIISLVVLSGLGFDLTIREEFLPIKTIKVLLYFVSTLCYLQLLLLFTEKMSLDQVLLPFVYVFFVITVVLFVEFVSPDFFSGFHYTERPNDRIRLFAGEASWTASMIEVYFVVSLFYMWYRKKSIILSVVVGFMFIMHILLSSSKTLLVATFLGIVYILILKFKKRNPSMMIWSILMLIPVFVFLYGFLLPQLERLFINDIENYTSTVTRSLTIVSAVIIGTLFPMGTGFSAYLVLMPKMISRLLPYVSAYNTDEILMYLYDSSDAALSAKSYLTQNTMYWGVIGTFIFFKALFKLYHNCFYRINIRGKWLFKCLFWILLFQICLSSGLQYDILAFIFLMIFISKRSFVIKGLRS